MHDLGFNFWCRPPVLHYLQQLLLPNICSHDGQARWMVAAVSNQRATFRVDCYYPVRTDGLRFMRVTPQLAECLYRLLYYDVQ